MPLRRRPVERDCDPFLSDFYRLGLNCLEWFAFLSNKGKMFDFFGLRLSFSFYNDGNGKIVEPRQQLLSSSSGMGEKIKLFGFVQIKGCCAFLDSN